MPHDVPGTRAQASEIIAAHAQAGRRRCCRSCTRCRRAFGYVPDEAVPLIAEALNLSRAEVHGVVTFYHDFRREPAGRHVLKLCRAEACQSMGGEALAAQARERLGIDWRRRPRRRPRDARSRSTASGLCACAPAAMLDGELVGRLDAERARRADRARRGAMTPRIFVPRDAAALAVGADEVARGDRRRGARRGLDVEIVRTGSRGLFWLEPLVEVETAGGPRRLRPGRRRATSPGLFDAGLLDGGAHRAAPRPARGDPVPRSARRG